MRPNPMCAGYRFPAKVISCAAYLHFGFPVSLRMVKEMLALRGISVSTLAAKAGSLERLKVRSRCGWNWLAS